MRTSETIADLSSSLATAAAEIENVTKDATNPHFKSTYATLAAVLDVCRPALAKQQIAILQSTWYEAGNGTVEVTTRLMHASGQWIETTASAVPSKTDAQGIGAVTTYLRRYALAAMCGVAQEDDDGESAAHGNGPQTRGNVNDRPAQRQGQNNAPKAAKHEPDVRQQVRTQIRQRIDAMAMSDELAPLLAKLDGMSDEELRDAKEHVADLYKNFAQ